MQYVSFHSFTSLNIVFSIRDLSVYYHDNIPRPAITFIQIRFSTDGNSFLAENILWCNNIFKMFSVLKSAKLTLVSTFFRTIQVSEIILKQDERFIFLIFIFLVKRFIAVVYIEIKFLSIFLYLILNFAILVLLQLLFLIEDSENLSSVCCHIFFFTKVGNWETKKLNTIYG